MTKASTILYMAVNGDDNWSGSLREPSASRQDGPFRTLDAVRKKIGELTRQGNTGDVTVLVRGGTYFLNKPVILTLNDWPSAEDTLTISAYPGETPVFSSGVRVEGWRKAEEELDNLPEAARGHIWEADVPAELEDRKFRTLFQGEKRLPRARSIGFAPVLEFQKIGDGENWATENKDTLHFPEGTIRNYSNLEDVELIIRPTFQWVFNILPLKSVDEESCVARTAISGTYPLKKLYNLHDHPVSCWVENALDFLDEPGEWVLDSNKRKLYILHEGNDNPGDDIYIPALQEFVRIEGDEDREIPIRRIVMHGFTFTHGERDTWTEGDAGIQHDWDMYDKANAMVRLRWAEHCRIEHCRLINSGSSAVRLDLYCKFNSVIDNEIAYIGGTGILLCGYGPGTKDVNQSNRVENNDIHHCGESYWHAPAVFVWQSGDNSIAHNRIHHTPYSGIVISGVRYGHLEHKDLRECSRTIRWEELGDLPDTIQDWEEFVPYQHARSNRIECNELYAVMEKLGDGNAIYLSGTGDHNIVSGNYIHDIIECHMQSAIRVDDFQRQTHIVHNLIHKCCGGGITLKHLNYVENNIVADLLPVTGSDGTLIYPKGYILLRRGPSTGATIQRNILYKTSIEGDFYHEGRGILAGSVRNCETDSNLYWCAVNPIEAMEMLEINRRDGIDSSSLCADPMFAHADEGDYRLVADSPAYRLGIKPIDISQAGLINTILEGEIR